MQTAAIRAHDHAGFDGRHDPSRAVVARACLRRTDVVERLEALLTAGISRAPTLERNPMLASLFGRRGAAFDSATIAEAVARWLAGDHAAPVSAGGPCSETRTLTTLLRDAWRGYPELRPIVVEGSPDAPRARTLRDPALARRTHHFVVLRMGGRLYVIDGARGLLFDSLRAYLSAVTLPGLQGGWSARMRWFRIVEEAGEAGGGVETLN
ncbi:MAG: hypothetical protein FJX20_22875 [Alphaproteobacteria bacterium]|nr:hypothetical protein [Alphaproteobacteria bacterium]